MRIAVLGLGRMGWHLAAHLSDSAVVDELAVFDVVDGLASRWADENSGEVADSVTSAVTGAEFIITSLPADQELQVVADELVSVIGTGAVWVDHSTVSARLARTVSASVSAADAYFLDAPVSGGVDGARKGVLTVMVGGDEGAFARAEPVVGSYASRIRRMGGPGAGQLTNTEWWGDVSASAQGPLLDMRNFKHSKFKGTAYTWARHEQAQKHGTRRRKRQVNSLADGDYLLKSTEVRR